MSAPAADRRLRLTDAYFAGLIVAASVAADALPLATFDRGQRRYGIATREP
ncbi:MAG TPA: hypothetical protein VFH79_09635 [Candidatus Limnocylindria bacterium]|nr:hypothetical protein [Candidatus Limnocylindria bacterium]